MGWNHKKKQKQPKKKKIFIREAQQHAKRMQFICQNSTAYMFTLTQFINCSFDSLSSLAQKYLLFSVSVAVVVVAVVAVTVAVVVIVFSFISSFLNQNCNETISACIRLLCTYKIITFFLLCNSMEFILNFYLVVETTHTNITHTQTHALSMRSVLFMVATHNFSNAFNGSFRIFFVFFFFCMLCCWYNEFLFYDATCCN